jgi:hypothetical protein
MSQDTTPATVIEPIDREGLIRLSEKGKAKVHLEGDAPREELDALIAHSDRWSPVANTLRMPVDVQVRPA